VEIEREGFVGKVSLIHESWEVVNRDGVVSETEDTGHLGGNERNSGGAGDFTEAHRGGDIITDHGNILGDSSLNTPDP